MQVTFTQPSLYKTWQEWAEALTATLEGHFLQIDDWLAGDLRTTIAQVYDSQSWVLADGTTLLKTEQPGLYRAIGETFNTGAETADEFSVPNLTPFPADQIILVKL